MSDLDKFLRVFAANGVNGGCLLALADFVWLQLRLIFSAILNSDPPPAIRFNRDIPPKLEDIINKSAGERPQSALPKRGRRCERICSG